VAKWRIGSAATGGRSYTTRRTDEHKKNPHDLFDSRMQQILHDVRANGKTSGSQTRDIIG